MRYTYHTLVILLSLCISIYTHAQQRQMYTQFMYNKQNLNPAYAGNESYLGLSLLYRNQWIGLSGAPEAQVFSINLPRLGQRVGIGLNFERQSVGISEKLTYEMCYAYKFFFGNGTLSMGMSVSGRQYTIDFNDPRLSATEGLENDPSIPSGLIRFNNFNTGFGIYYNTNNFFLGISLPRMIRSDLDFDNNVAFSQEVRHANIMTGGTFIINNDIRFTPQLLLQASENAPMALDLNGALTWKDTYSVGCTYRTGGGPGSLGESLDIIVSYQLSDRLMLGTAYDITLSKIRSIDNGSLEILLNYNFIPKKIKTILVNPRYF